MKDQQITLLTGAGLSKIIGLPMTNEFKLVIDESQKYPVHQLLKDFLKDKYYDIECIMSALDDLISPKSSIQNYLLQNMNLIGVDNSVIQKNLRSIILPAEKYCDYVKNQIYILLDKFNIIDSSTLYFNLLSSIKNKYPNRKINLFTTNYDLSFEKSLIGIQDKLNKELGISNINFGFKYKYNAIVESFDTYDNDEQVLDYYKIHGSLDWHFDEQLGCVKSGTNARPSNPSSMPILFPGFKDKPKDEIFIKLHELFFKKISNSSHIIIIGFALRDPYINELITYSLSANKDCRVVYYNPLPKDKLPPESGIHNLMKLFPDNILYLEKGLDKDNINFENDFSVVV